VAHVIRLLRDELEMTMALTGISNIRKITQKKNNPGNPTN
jgi:4-hydroxymandelate oxidase